MDWAAAQETLQQVVAAAAGLPASVVTWGGTPERNGWCDPNGATIALTVRRLESVIGEERRVMYLPGPPAARVVTLCGNRLLQVQAKVEAQDQRPAHDSVAIASRLRTLIRSRVHARCLRAVGLGVADILPTVHADYTDAQRRVVSVAIVELRLNAADNLIDTLDAAPWIERVGITPRAPIDHPAIEVS